MRVVIDTNVLLHAAQPAHPQHAPAMAGLDRLSLGGHEGVVVPQVLYEYWVVVTRPEGLNGLGMRPDAAKPEYDRIKRLFKVLPDTPAVLPVWEELVVRFACVGKPAHDARLAAMKVHDVPATLTFNADDFRRFDGLEVLDPVEVAKA